jgi:hypothetical protein
MSASQRANVAPPLAGFEYAPLTRVLMLTTGCMSVVRLKFSPFPSSPLSAFLDLVTFPFGFSSPMNIVVGLMLLFHFRHFERTHGTRKFLTTVCLSVCVTMLIRFLLLHARVVVMYGVVPLWLIPSGPYVTLFCFLVNYWFEVPGTATGSKSMVYLLAAQLLFGDVIGGSLLASVIGILLGVLRFHRSSHVAYWLLPQKVMDQFYKVFSFARPPKPHVKIARSISQRIGAQQQLLNSFNRR